MQDIHTRQLKLAEFFQQHFDPQTSQSYTATDLPFSLADSCWHVYGDLRLHNELEAPSDSAHAKQLLNVLERYTQSAEGAALAIGGYLIEAQGSRVHILIPDSLNNPERPIAFAKAFNEAVYHWVRRAAGQHFSGFSMACDHGDAILVRSSFAGVLSEVSLGDAANQPAKRLGKTPGVPARHLSLLTKFLVPNGKTGLVVGWQEVDLTSSNISLPPNYEIIRNSVRDAFEESTDGRDFEFETRIFNKAGAHYAGAKAFQTFGFCLRADLDGFTSKVKAAQNSSDPNAISQLARDFHNLMKQAENFVINFGEPITPLPWAGDCANLLFLMNTHADYQRKKSLTPVRASVVWNDDVSKGSLFAGNGQSTAWSIGIAADETPPAHNSNGNILVATLNGRRRSFPIGIGPGVKWSLEGEQAEGLDAHETAIFKPDLIDLAPRLRQQFSTFKNNSGQENSNFEKARHAALKAALNQEKEDQKKKMASVSVSTVAGNTVPKPRSYFQHP